MAEAIYVHWANDGGIFAVRGGTGQAGWITRAILLKELNAPDSALARFSSARTRRRAGLHEL